MPINVIPTRDAVESVCRERALFLDVNTFQTYDWESWVVNWDDAIRASDIESDKVIHTASYGLFKPEVIVCSEYKGMGWRPGIRRPKFSRSNVYRLYKNRCAYCGGKFDTKDLELEHVIPKSQGGEMSWTNIVLACTPCNSKKQNRTPKQAGMRLRVTPHQPKAEELRLSPVERLRHRIGRNPPKTWEQFLGKMYWNVELQD
jgi:5-methylcytosine-specific restriction endonuclease McrA